MFFSKIKRIKVKFLNFDLKKLTYLTQKYLFLNYRCVLHVLPCKLTSFQFFFVWSDYIEIKAECFAILRLGNFISKYYEHIQSKSHKID